MSLRIFDDQVAVAEELKPDEVSFWARLIFCGGASLVAGIPCLATSFSALGVTNLLRGMKNAETAGMEYVLNGIHVSNRPLVIALGISAVLSFVTALVLATDEKRRMAAVGFPFSIGVPIIAATPALFLWFPETIVIDVVTGKITEGPISEVAQTIANFLFAAVGLGLLAQGVLFVCSVISLCIPVRKRTDPAALRRAFPWTVSGTLLLVFAGAYFTLV